MYGRFSRPQVYIKGEKGVHHTDGPSGPSADYRQCLEELDHCANPGLAGRWPALASRTLGFACTLGTLLGVSGCSIPIGSALGARSEEHTSELQSPDHLV